MSRLARRSSASSTGSTSGSTKWGGRRGHDAAGIGLTIEPQFRIPEERIFLRLEDMIVITDTEARIISDFVPRSIADVERVIAEEGLRRKYGKIH